MLYRLLALEDRFQDLEGLQSRTTKSEQQKYAQFIVSCKIGKNSSVNILSFLESTRSKFSTRKRNFTSQVNKLKEIFIITLHN